MAKKKKLTGFARFPENINRKGRPPKGETLTDMIREYGEENDGEKRKELIKTMYDIAIKNKDVAMLKYLVDRQDGRPKQSVDVGEKNIDIEVDIVDDEEGDEDE